MPVLVWSGTFAQSIPAAPSEIEFAGVSVQLTNPARQRLQQSLNSLYADRVSLLHQVEMMNQLRPVLDARLLAQNTPLDFRYAAPPLTEPAYDSFAYWGLKKSMAQQLQLLINPSIDDRRHVLMSSDAVIPYINQLHKQTGHWIKTLFQLLEPTQKPLLDETSPGNWLLDLAVPPATWTVLARKIAFEHEQALLRLTTPFVLLEYDEGNGKTLSDIALRLKLNTDRLSPYNSWLLADRIPDEGNFPVILRLTPEEYLTVKPRLSPKASRQSSSNILLTTDLGFPILRRLDPNQSYKSVLFYEINDRRGIQAQLCDNAITLSYYGNMSVPTFLFFNDLPEQAILKPGEIYYIQRKAKRAKIPFHVVQQGQSLWDISSLYGIRLKSLLNFNRMKSTQRVQAGRIIWMQKRRPAKTPVEFRSAPPIDNRALGQPIVNTNDPDAVTDSTALKLKSLVTSQSDAPLLELPQSPARPDSVTAKSEGSSIVKKMPPAVVLPAPTRVVQPAAVRPTVTSVHVVKPGQTYYSIAKLYGTTVKQLFNWNNLTGGEVLQVGQELRIINASPAISPPVPNRAAAPAPAVAPRLGVAPLPINQKAQYYTVKPGENLYRIALNHRVSLAEMMRWNKLKTFTVEVGQRLLVRPEN